MKNLTQGARANFSGRSAEQVIGSILFRKNIEYREQKYIGIGIYGNKLRVDFYIKKWLPYFPEGLIIESKWQDTPGTADEKLPYLLQNIRERFPCPAIIVISGGGHRIGAVKWAKKQVGKCKNLYAIFSLDELLSWINRL